MSRRAVVYLYTQTGQLREVAEAFVAPLEAEGWRIRWVDVQPRVALPFPWSIRQFFGIFPRAVDPDAFVELVEPPGGFGPEQDEQELVLLAYQVWYLSPSLPIRSLMAGHPEAFRNRRVISLIACRNMWYSAAIEVANLLRTAGTRSLQVVVATDTRRQATSLVTTLRWLLTGKREPFLWFGRAGVDDAELARITAVGRSIAQQGSCPADAAPLVPTLAAADLFAGRLFRKWGVIARSAERLGAAAHAASLVVFVVGLAAGIVAGLPLIASAALAGGARFETWISGAVHRRISFGELTAHEGAKPEQSDPMSAPDPGYNELIHWLTAKVAGYVGLPPDAIGIDIPLADCGLDSISGLALCADLSCEKGFDVETTIVWDYATIDAIATYLAEQRGAA